MSESEVYEAEQFSTQNRIIGQLMLIIRTFCAFHPELCRYLVFFFLQLGEVFVTMVRIFIFINIACSFFENKNDNTIFFYFFLICLCRGMKYLFNPISTSLISS